MSTTDSPRSSGTLLISNVTSLGSAREKPVFIFRFAIVSFSYLFSTDTDCANTQSSTKQATEFEIAQSDNESLSSFARFNFLCANLRKVSHELTGRLKHDIHQLLNVLEKLERKDYAKEWLNLTTSHPLWISDISNSRLVNEVLSMLISQAAEGKLHQSIILVSPALQSFFEALELTLTLSLFFPRFSSILSNVSQKECEQDLKTIFVSFSSCITALL